ncbi:MAG: hypothetical protein ABJC12_13355 [Saprospiraceae bacterium]
MILDLTDGYVKICMNTWLLCEVCIHAEEGKKIPKKKLLMACKQCSDSCMSVISMFISNSSSVHQKAFDCFLFCRQCHKECTDEDTEYCASVCDKCAEMMKELMLLNLN